MIIDFHTHVFPDDVAPKALAIIVENIKSYYLPVNDGTVSGLIRNMDDWGVDVSVAQPIVIKQEQFRRINEWTAGIGSDRVLPFGGISPRTDDYKRDIDFVVSLGLKGLKFHAEYQNFIVDDDHMLKVYDYALSKGLILLHHAGFDPEFPPPIKSSPRQFARIVDEMRGGVIVAAHLGGCMQWDDVERDLAGKDIYLDTSAGFEFYPRDQFLRILEKHGADKILFGSDAPWTNAGTEIEILRSLPIPDEDKAAILGGNAKRILGI